MIIVIGMETMYPLKDFFKWALIAFPVDVLLVSGACIAIFILSGHAIPPADFILVVFSLYIITVISLAFAGAIGKEVELP